MNNWYKTKNLKTSVIGSKKIQHGVFHCNKTCFSIMIDWG